MAHYFDGPLYLDATSGDPNDSKGTRKRKRADVDSDDYETGDESQSVKNRHAPKTGTREHNLRAQHYHVLNTILHRCLLEQDYPRASRALGTLLRFEVGGRRCNVRKHNLWILASEILLRRDPATNAELGKAYLLEGGNDKDHPSDNVDRQTDPTLTLDGFRQTRQYLDLLIVQHPKKQHHFANLDSAEQFYPVMFRLWILQVQSEAERSMRKLLWTDPGNGAANNGPEPSINRDQIQALAARILNTQRDRANDILSSITELLGSPIYDKNTALLSLRSEIETWVHNSSPEHFNQTQTLD